MVVTLIDGRVTTMSDDNVGAVSYVWVVITFMNMQLVTIVGGRNIDIFSYSYNRG